MTLLSRRSRPPTAPRLRDRLDAFVKAFRVPDGATIEALSEGLTAQACMDAGRCYPPEQVIEDAFNVYVKASETLRRAGRPDSVAVRGCTTELLVLVIQQALDLAKHLDQQGKQRVAQAAALAAVQHKLRASFSKALSLREQARRLLATMAPDDSDHLDEVLRAASATDDKGSAAAAMFALAAIGRRLLAGGSAKMGLRARLVGLDEPYLTTLEALGYDLKQGQEELSRLTRAAHMPDDALYAEAGLTLHLMMYVIEAFAAAHEVDASVPLLRPEHTQRMVRRMSRLPPPPPPSPTLRPLAKVPDLRAHDVRNLEPSIQDSDAPKTAFRGGLGSSRR